MTTPLRMADPAHIAPGSLLAERYEIVRALGGGGDSMVYLARDRKLRRDVAVKVLTSPPTALARARERLRHEVQAVGQLSHPHIVSVFDFVDAGSWCFIVMEYVDGRNLEVQVDGYGPLGVEHAARLGYEIADALHAAHRRGILHRDVKPSNILLASDGRARLTGFGSVPTEREATLGAPGGMVEALRYTAPEIVAGGRGDARSDIYALGMSLYFAVTGEPPDLTSWQVPPAPASDGHRVSAGRPAIPAWLEQAAARATAPPANARFPTAAGFAEALHDRVTGASGVPVDALAQACLICGEPEAFSAGLCIVCGGCPGIGDTLLFAERQKSGVKRKEVVKHLDAVLRTREAHGALEAAAAGWRAIARVPRSNAQRVVDELARRGIPTYAVPARRAWAPLPLSFYALLALIVVMGAVAGVVVMRLLGWVSPLVTGLLLVNAQLQLRTPLIGNRPASRRLPSALENKVFETLGRLPRGTARGLLTDIVRSSEASLGTLGRSGHGTEVGQLEQTLVHACDASLDLAVLDGGLSRWEHDRSRVSGGDGGGTETVNRCQRARDRLVQQLLEVLAALRRTQHRPIEPSASRGLQLMELVRELEQHVEIRARAAREIEELLGPVPVGGEPFSGP